MLLKASTALAIVAIASQAVAERVPYKPNNAVRRGMSATEIFGLVRRQGDGYTPTQAYCGTGQTCAEACGAGFEVCTSADNAIHCYDPTAKQTCCPDGTGSKFFFLLRNSRIGLFAVSWYRGVVSFLTSSRLL